LIAAFDIASARAAKSKTQSIPIVFVIGGDPIAAGLVTNIARPSGNLTGVSFVSTELMPKRLQLLSDLVTQAKVIALLVNPNSPNTELMMRNMPDGARAKGLQLHILKASAAGEIDGAFAALAQLHAGALVVGADALFFSERDRVVALASHHAVPAIYDYGNSSWSAG
jgi:putative ABC transport system substrate-binding protein